MSPPLAASTRWAMAPDFLFPEDMLVFGVALVADLATLTLFLAREPTLASSSALDSLLWPSSVTYSIRDPAFSAPTSIPEASISQPLTMEEPRAPSWCSGPSCGWDL